MALALYDRVQETTATTGTGSITLGGAVSGYQSFAVVGDGNTCYYTIVNGSAWEVGIGTYSTTGPSLARTTILSNSNADTNPITLVGASSVFLTYPAEKSVNLDVDGVMAVGQPLSYSDTGILATFVSTDTDYNQVVIQNKSNSPTASANLNISNNVSTGTTGFAELGINSSAFTGTNSFELPGAAYLASASTDLTIGTYGAYNIHFVTNSNDIDAMTIHNDGGISLGELNDPGIGNIACNNINLKFQQVVTAAGTTTLTNASPYYTQFTGTTTQTLKLPDATTCLVGTTFILDNDSTDDVTIKDGADSTFELLIPGGIHNFVLEDNSTVAGTWLRYSLIPSTAEWGTNSLQLSTTVISGGTWQGGTIQSGYGGTGLTTFTAANNALYSTSASTLTAGTLPIAAGGTGRTSFTSGYIPYGNGTSGLNSSSSLQFNGTYLVVGGATPLGGATNPITAFSSTAAGYVQTYVYNTSNDISASADFVTYADNSTDAHGWADMGFTSSTYDDPVYTVTGPNEAYVFGSAPSGAGATGNLVYATDSTGSSNAHQWYVGGFTQLKSAWKMQLTSTGLQLANALGVAYGGSGATTAQGAMNTFAGAVTSGSYLRGNGTNVVMSTIQAADVPTLNQNTTGQAGSVANALTFNTSGGVAAGSTYNGSAAKTVDYSTIGASPLVGSTSLTTVGTIATGTWSATTIAANKGGTGQTTYAVGDLLYADTTSSLAKLADVATGNALISGGVGVAPSWGKIGLTTHVSGTLPIANGGTNSTATPTAGGVGYGTGSAYAFTSAGTSGQVLTSGGASAPSWTTSTNANTASAIVQRDASGNFSAGTITASLTGNVTGNVSGSSGSCGGNSATATNLSTNRTNWSTNGTISAVVGQLSWKNYGNNHTIFDASASTSPDGTAVNNTNPTYAWSASYPTLMGWNGSSTYGVRVDSARVADSATTATTATYLSGTGQTSLIVGKVCTTVDINAANDTGSFSVRGDTTYPAAMSFHRAGAYAINVGLSTANNFVIGGWSASSNAFSMTGGGALTMLNNITAYSDETLKKNWRDLPLDYVERLAEIKHGIYDRIDQESTQVGVSAQSLRPLLPDAVMVQEDGKLSVAYGNAAMVSAVQLAKRVVEQDERIAKLEALVAQLLEK